MTRQIAILSGKGGAGKTSITASLIKLLDSVVAVDADVNASNLPILLPHRRESTQPYFGMDIAQVEHGKCTGCGACLPICKFDAISPTADGEISIADDCEGCASCAFACPHDAIRMVARQGGAHYLSSMGNGFLVHADLIPGQDNSGKLITRIRTEASAVAKQQDIAYIVIDGPPGTSCQAISSITGTDRILAVVEESLSGLSDYRRLAELINKFSIPHDVLINKAGCDPAIAERIELAAEEFGGRLSGRIPFDRKIPQALQNLQSPADMDDYKGILSDVLNRLLEDP